MLLKKILLGAASSLIGITPQTHSWFMNGPEPIFSKNEDYSIKEIGNIRKVENNTFKKNLDYNYSNSISPQISDIKKAGSFWPSGDFRRDDIYGLYVHSRDITENFNGQHIQQFSNNVEYDHWYTYTVGEFKIKYTDYATSPEDFIKRYPRFRASAHIMANFWNERDGWFYSGGANRSGLTFTYKNLILYYADETPALYGYWDLWKWEEGHPATWMGENEIEIFSSFDRNREIFNIEMELKIKLSAHSKRYLSGAIIKVRYPQLLFIN